MIFQIRDDEIGLFGDEALVGKPVGSDIREGKKTVFFARLASILAGAERTRFLEVFGNKLITLADIDFVRNLVEKYGIRRRNMELVKHLSDECSSDIERLAGVAPEKKELLRSLLNYNLTRGI